MGPWLIVIWSFTGPQTTPLAPAYAQPRTVMTPGRDLTFDFTWQVLHCPVGSLAARCLARSFFDFSGYASRTSSIIFWVSLIFVLITFS